MKKGAGKLKRISVVGLAAMMILNLYGCAGNGGKATETSQTDASAAQTTSEEKQTEDAETEQAESTGFAESSHGWYRNSYKIYQAPGTSEINKNTDADTLYYGSTAGIVAADPNNNQDEYCWSQQVYDTLIKRSLDGETDFVPGLATEWGYDSDGNFNITLRENVKFHDGTILDADDVLFSLKRVSESNINKCAGSMRSIDYEKSFQTDDTHLTLVFKNAVGSLVNDLSTGYCGILSKEFCEENPDVAFYDCDAGSGPYMLKESVTGVSQTFERFDDYWDGQPDFKYVFYKLYKDYTVEAIDFMNGDLDIAMNIDNSTLTKFMNEEMPGVTMYEIPSRSLNLEMATRGDVVFSDVRLRQALAHCIDYDSIITGLYGNTSMATRTTSVLPIGTKYEVDLGTIAYDPELSQSLLEECGYSLSNPCKVKMVCTNGTAITACANIIQAYGAAVGFDIQVDIIDSSGASAIKNSPAVPAEYDMIIITSQYNTGSPESLLSGRTMYGMDPANVSGMTGIEDERMNEVAQQAAQSTDEDLRAELYAELQELFYENYWVIQMYGINTMNLVQGYLGEVNFISGYHPQLYTISYRE